MSEPGRELEPYEDPFRASAAALEVVEEEAYRVTTGPLEVRRAVAVPEAVPRPDWIIIGQPAGDRVLLFASLTLSYAELKREVDGFDVIQVLPSANAPMARVPRERVIIKAEMASFTLINGEDYPSALRSLMELWARARPQS